MFSGIVQKMGRIKTLDLAEKWGRISLEFTDWDPPLQASESVAIQGICLTATSVKDGVVSFDVLRETFERTNLGDKQVGQQLNMERSLRWGEPLGGHIVVGHVDGVGAVRAIRSAGRDWSYEFTCGPEMLDGVVFKGSISVDGVSLTIAELKSDGFVVHIIPFTQENTTFCELKVGSRVNLEVDLLGKFVRRLLERGRIWPEVTWDKLRREGLIRESATPGA